MELYGHRVERITLPDRSTTIVPKQDLEYLTLCAQICARRLGANEGGRVGIKEIMDAPIPPGTFEQVRMFHDAQISAIDSWVCPESVKQNIRVSGVYTHLCDFIKQASRFLINKQCNAASFKMSNREVFAEVQPDPTLLIKSVADMAARSATRDMTAHWNYSTLEAKIGNTKIQELLTAVWTIDLLTMINGIMTIIISYSDPIIVEHIALTNKVVYTPAMDYIYTVTGGAPRSFNPIVGIVLVALIAILVYLVVWYRQKHGKHSAHHHAHAALHMIQPAHISTVGAHAKIE